MKYELRQTHGEALPVHLTSSYDIVVVSYFRHYETTTSLWMTKHIWKLVVHPACHESMRWQKKISP